MMQKKLAVFVGEEKLSGSIDLFANSVIWEASADGEAAMDDILDMLSDDCFEDIVNGKDEACDRGFTLRVIN